MPYQPKHARHPDPSELPSAMRGLADMIVIVPSSDESSEADR